MIGRPSRVLVRALWQTVNIGDVAHAPGTLRAFQRWWADAELILWPRAADERTRSMLRRFLPEVRVVEGVVDGDGRASTPELADALDAADLFVHGSGPSLNAEREVRSWRRRTGRPYGFFGVTVDPMWSSSRRPGTGTLDRLADRAAGLPAGDLADDTRELLDGAAFVFCRDAISLDYVRAQHVAAPVVEFGPDATFAFDLHDRPVAEGILRAAGLHRRDPGFLCVVPRLRYTPYHQIGRAHV